MLHYILIRIKKLSLSYNPYFKVTNERLVLDIKKLETDIVRPIGTVLQLSHDGSFSLNESITNLINVRAS